MAISTSCCFKLSPKPPSSTPLARPRTEIQQIYWRNQCAVGIACAIISLQTVNLIGNEEMAMASAATPNIQSIVATSNKEKIIKRWSDKRTCQPWQLNSLETIVPENLPRPSFHRKLEAAGFSKIAPPLIKAATTEVGTNCFSM